MALILVEVRVGVKSAWPSFSRGAGASRDLDSSLWQEWWQEELPLLEILRSPVHLRLLLAGCAANTLPALSGHPIKSDSHFMISLNKTLDHLIL